MGENHNFFIPHLQVG